MNAHDKAEALRLLDDLVDIDRLDVPKYRKLQRLRSLLYAQGEAATDSDMANEPDPELPCSDFAYTAIEAVLPDGTRIVLDCDEASKR